MTKKKNNTILLGIITMMLMFTIFMLPESTQAANTADTTWTFNLSVNNSSYQYTARRQKQDYSRMYFNWRSSVGQLSAFYVASFAHNGSRFIPAGNMNMELVQYRVTSTGQYTVSNFVKENGYTYGALGFLGASGSGTATGEWSPDTATNIPAIQ